MRTVNIPPDARILVWSNILRQCVPTRDLALLESEIYNKILKQIPVLQLLYRVSRAQKLPPMKVDRQEIDSVIDTLILFRPE